jgi:hypothetical protein
MNELIPNNNDPTFVTPARMLDRAVAAGASIEMVEKLMKLMERQQENEARKAFDAAMANAAAELPTIAKTKLVDFTSPKGRTRYQYASLDDVTAAVRPVLAKHGLSFRFRTIEEQDRLMVICRIAHADGHSEESMLSAPRDESGQKNYIQSKGSTLTYLQRYTLMSALGLAAAIDDDGRGSGATAPAARISAEQAAQLTALVSDIALPGLIDRMRARLKVAAVEDIPADMFGRTVAWLNKVKQAEAAQQEASPAVQEAAAPTQEGQEP